MLHLPKMRILLSDVHTSGGGSSMMLLLGRELATRGHDVTAHLGHDGPRASSWMKSGVEVVASGQLVDLLLAERYDVVNLTEDDLWLLGGPGLRASRTPIVLSVVSTRVHLRVGGVDHVVTVSRPIADGLRLRGGRPPVTVIRNAVDTRQFRRDGDVEEIGSRPVALWIGRVNDARKDVAAYLRALDDLGPEWQGLIVTDPRQRRLTDVFRADHPGLRVESRPWEDMAALYRGVARTGGCLVLSSQEEGDPLAVGEALASGLPVAARRIDGVQAWIDTGGVAVAEHADDLARTVRHAIGAARASLLDAADAELRGPRSLNAWVDAFEEVFAATSRRSRPRASRWVAAQLTGERRVLAARPPGARPPMGPSRGGAASHASGSWSPPFAAPTRWPAPSTPWRAWATASTPSAWSTTRPGTAPSRSDRSGCRGGRGSRWSPTASTTACRPRSRRASTSCATAIACSSSTTTRS